MTKIFVTADIVIGESELDESFIRSAGPGGQNVNKVASAVQIRFDVAHSPALPEPVRDRLFRLAGRRLSKEGILVLTANRFRSQERNRADARERLIELIRDAATIAPPRRPTRTPRAAKKRRSEAKKKRAALKRLRGTPSEE